jgi:hypothetical protein
VRAAEIDGRLSRFRLRTSRTVLLIATLLATRTVAAQDSTATRTPPDQPVQSLAPRTLSGRVVRPGRSGMVTVSRAWVTLHRVAADSSGPVDSVRTDANGRYSLRYKPAGGDAVYFASSTYSGVAYFTTPLPPRDAAGDDAEITVFDTTSAPVPVHTRGRHLVVSSSNVDGRRTLVEVFELSNDSTVTAVSGARGRATWSAPLSPNGRDFQVGQSDIGVNAVQFRDGRLLVYASFSPGIRQIAFSYSVPASDFPLEIPVGDPVGVFEVLVEDPGATASGGGLAEQQPVSLEGRSFRRFLAQDVRSGAKLVISVGAPTAPRGNRMLRVPVVVAAVVMSLALAFALTRRRSAGVLVHAEAPHDAAHIARDIAELDDAFERVESPSDAERDTYHQRREALKARLSAALAKEEVPV